MKIRSVLAMSVTSLLVLISTASVHAGFADSAQIGQNTYVDVSSEFVDYNGHGTSGIQVGDTIYGFNVIQSDRTTGANYTTSTIVDIFSFTVQSFNSAGTQVNFTASQGGAQNPTNSSDTLQSILGSHATAAQLPNGTMVAAYDVSSSFGTSLATGTAPIDPSTGSAATNMAGYLRAVAANGTFDFSAGLGSTPSNDFFYSTFNSIGSPLQQIVANSTFVTGPTQVAATSTLLNTLAPSSGTLGNGYGGMDVLTNDTPVVFGLVTDQNSPLTPKVNISIFDDNFSGASGTTDYSKWGNPGVNDNASFGFNVTAIAPEPSSLILFGFGFGSLLVGAYRRKKAGEAA